MSTPLLEELVFEELSRARNLLATSPLVPSLELALGPLARAVDFLREPAALPQVERERLAREVAGIGQLLDGLGLWLASRGALSPTYTRAAALEMSSEPARLDGQLAYEG